MDKSLELRDKINENGDLIVDKTENGGLITEVVKYGVIKFYGDDKEYRVSYKTLWDITNKPENFKGNIVIPELHMKVPLSSICFQQIREEKNIIKKSFTKLPTEDFVCLATEVGEEFKPAGLSEREAKKKMDEYWLIQAHYIEQNGVKRFDYNFNHVKSAILVRCVEDGVFAVSKSFSYGEEIMSNGLDNL